MIIVVNLCIYEKLKQIFSIMLYNFNITQKNMDSTRNNQNKSTVSRSTYLPTISSPQTISYAQKYQHTTKMTNYNELNESQIWKQYEKLRICLKQLNQQVLYQMQKKANTNLYTKQAPPSPSVQATLIILDEERKTNQSRLQNFVNDATKLEQRVQQLTKKTQYLAEVNNEIQITESKIKQIELQNKDHKRKQKLMSKDLIESQSPLQKLMAEQQQLYYVKKIYEKYDQTYKDSVSKTQQFKQKINQYQNILQNRLNQYKQQQDYVVEELNLQRFQQLQNQKTNLTKYDSIYKRNYLMKLKQLQTLINSINKHDQVIQETQSNILTMRGQIDQISALVTVNQHKRRSSSTMMMPTNNQSRSVKKSIIIDTSLALRENQVMTEAKNSTKTTSANDKNRTPSVRY